MREIRSFQGFRVDGLLTFHFPFEAPRNESTGPSRIFVAIEVIPPWLLLNCFQAFLRC